MRYALGAAVILGIVWASLVAPTALAMPVVKSTTIEASVEKVGYWRRQYRRSWRRGYPVPYAYYPPVYGYYAPPPAYAYYQPYGYAPPPPPNGDYGTYAPEYGNGDYPPENGY